MSRSRRREVEAPVALPKKFPASGGDGYLSVAQARLDFQMSTIDALDSKAGTAISTALAEAAFLAALLALRPADALPLHEWYVTLLLAGVCLLFIASLYHGVRGILVRRWHTYPNPSKTWSLALKPDLEWELARVLDSAFEKNLDNQSLKARHVRRSAVMLGLLTISVIATSGALLWPTQ